MLGLDDSADRSNPSYLKTTVYKFKGLEGVFAIEELTKFADVARSAPLIPGDRGLQTRRSPTGTLGRTRGRGCYTWGGGGEAGGSSNAPKVFLCGPAAGRSL